MKYLLVVLAFLVTYPLYAITLDFQLKCKGVDKDNNTVELVGFDKETGESSEAEGFINSLKETRINVTWHRSGLIASTSELVIVEYRSGETGKVLILRGKNASLDQIENKIQLHLIGQLGVYSAVGWRAEVVCK